MSPWQQSLCWYFLKPLGALSWFSGVSVPWYRGTLVSLIGILPQWTCFLITLRLSISFLISSSPLPPLYVPAIVLILQGNSLLPKKVWCNSVVLQVWPLEQQYPRGTVRKSPTLNQKLWGITAICCTVKFEDICVEKNLGSQVSRIRLT